MGKKNQVSKPPPGFGVNERNSPNLSDVSRSSNSTLPSELNECAVQEAISSTAKKPTVNISSLNYPRNPHPNSSFHRKHSNIPNPFLNKEVMSTDRSVLDLCVEKHDGFTTYSNRNAPIGTRSKPIPEKSEEILNKSAEKSNLWESGFNNQDFTNNSSWSIDGNKNKNTCFNTSSHKNKDI